MTLFYLPTCPHCHKVITWIEGHGVANDFSFVDVSASEDAAMQLEELSGQDAVPCLALDNGTTIVGDDPIISYLEELYA